MVVRVLAVRNVARDGQQSENEAKLLSNVVPWSTSSRLTFFMTRIDSTVWSSVMITTMFGRFGGSNGRRRADRPGGDGGDAQSTPAIEKQRISMDVRNS